jgi:hypothetical protein
VRFFHRPGEGGAALIRGDIDFFVLVMPVRPGYEIKSAAPEWALSPKPQETDKAA